MGRAHPPTQRPHGLDTSPTHPPTHPHRDHPSLELEVFMLEPEGCGAEEEARRRRLLAKRLELLKMVGWGGGVFVLVVVFRAARALPKMVGGCGWAGRWVGGCA